MSNKKLMEYYCVNSEEVESRKQYLNLEPSDFEILKSLRPFAEKIQGQVTQEFYDKLFAYEPFYQFIESVSKKKNFSLSEFRKKLEERHAEYFLSLFSGLPGESGVEWWEDYFESRMQYGVFNEEMNLPMQWFMGFYSNYNGIIIPQLMRQFWHRPLFVYKASMAISKLLNLDMQIILGTSLSAGIRSLGMNPSASDPILSLKENLQILKNQMECITKGQLDDVSMEQEVQGPLGKSFKEMTEKLSRMIGEMQEISQRTSGETARIQAEVEEQSSNSEKRSFTLKDLASNVYDLNLTSQQIADTVKSVATASEQALSGMMEIQNRVSEMTQRFKELGQKSEAAGNVSQMNGNLSEQTHLLSSDVAHLKDVVNEFHVKDGYKH